MNHDAIAEGGSGIEHRVRIDAAMRADPHPLGNDCSGFDAGSRADVRARLDDGAGGDGNTGGEYRIGRNHRGMMNTRQPAGAVPTASRHCANQRRGCAASMTGLQAGVCRHLRPQHDGPRVTLKCLGHRCLVLCKHKVKRICGLGGVHSINHKIGVALRQSATQLLNQFTQGQFVPPFSVLASSFEPE